MGNQSSSQKRLAKEKQAMEEKMRYLYNNVEYWEQHPKNNQNTTVIKQSTSKITSSHIAIATTHAKNIAAYIKENRNGSMVFDPTKTYFFRCGPCSMYSTVPYVLSYAETINRKSLLFWYPYDDPTKLSELPINLPPEAIRLAEPKNKAALDKVGVFVVQNQTWGLVIFLNTMENLYRGEVLSHWKIILSSKFFIDLLKQQAYFNQDQNTLINNIPSSIDDKPIHKELVPFFERLFPHQKLESGWMFLREASSYVKVPTQLEIYPLLDTGFYVDPQRPGEVFMENQIRMDVIYMPGAILASAIGSGKTISTIALIEAGKQLPMLKELARIWQEKQLEKLQHIFELGEKRKKLDELGVEGQILYEAAHNDVWSAQTELLKQQQQLDEHFRENLHFDFQKSDPQKAEDKSAYQQPNYFEKHQTHRQYEEVKSEEHKNPENPEPTKQATENNFIKEILQAAQAKNDSENINPFVDLEPFFENAGTDGPSLVIVTKNILQQWYDEFRKFSKSLRVLMVENEKDLSKAELVNSSGSVREVLELANYDIVLIHREAIAQMQNSLGKGNTRLIREIMWKRVIIDEVHEITNQLRKFKKKNLHLNTDLVGDAATARDLILYLQHVIRRFTWGITGTPDNLNFYQGVDPIFNVLDYKKEDLSLSSFKALEYAFFKRSIRKNVRSTDLPPLEKSTRAVAFTQIQKMVYKGKIQYALDEETAREICSHLLPDWNIDQSEGEDKFLKAAEQIQEHHRRELELYEKQITESKDEKENPLAKTHLENLKSEDNYYTKVIQALSKENFNCPICLNTDIPKKEIVLTECYHIVCISCWQEMFKNLLESACPMCKAPVMEKAVIIHPDFQHSKDSKMRVLMDEIKKVDPNEKILLFTQFTSLVNRLSKLFEKLNIPYIVLKGVPSEVNLSLQQFKQESSIKVLLMSIEQSASGINVTEANHVFFAHPIFGVTPEFASVTYSQCIGRAYRVGQTRPVYAKLFYTMDSVEEDMKKAFEDAEF